MTSANVCAGRAGNRASTNSTAVVELSNGNSLERNELFVRLTQWEGFNHDGEEHEMMVVDFQALAAPIVQLLGALGSGVLPVGSPADVLAVSSRTIEATRATAHTAAAQLDAAWTGQAADAALDKADQVQHAAERIAAHGDELAKLLESAAEVVQRGNAELVAIVESFATVAIGMGPMLITPAGQAALISAALDHLQRALAVVARVQAELEQHTAKLSSYLEPEDVPAAPEAPATGADAPAADSAPQTTAPAPSATTTDTTPADFTPNTDAAPAAAMSPPDVGAALPEVDPLPAQTAPAQVSPTIVRVPPGVEPEPGPAIQGGVITTPGAPTPRVIVVTPDDLQGGIIGGGK